MASLNKVILIGHVGQDPKITETSVGSKFASFSIATTEKWNDKSTGEKKEKTEWHNVCAFNKLAEIIEKYIAKGALIYVEGRIRTNEVTDDDGQVKKYSNIDITELKMLGKKTESGDESDSAEAEPVTQKSKPKQKPKATPAKGAQIPDDDDIPF